MEFGVRKKFRDTDYIESQDNTYLTKIKKRGWFTFGDTHESQTVFVDISNTWRSETVMLGCVDLLPETVIISNLLGPSPAAF